MTALSVVQKQETGELSPGEVTELNRLEGVIEKNLRAFYETGCALLKIRDSRLYRETHDTFEEYCRDRWDMTRDYAYKLIGSSEVVDNLENVDHGIQIKPTTERQARPLTKLETPEQQREVWEMAVETAPDGKITAKHVANVVKEIKNKTTKKKVNKNYNRFWLSIANQINKLADRMSKDGGFPIADNVKKETMGELVAALSLINHMLGGVK